MPAAWSECLQPAPFLAISLKAGKENQGLEVAVLNNDESLVYRQPRSLLELCSETVISDVRLCEGCLTAGLTSALFEHLFTAAVEKSKDLSIQTLISQWPYTSLSLASHGGRSEKDHERQLHRWLTGEIRHVDERDGIATLSVMQAFMNSLRKRAPSRLRVLDLRGYPCIDYGIEYLTGHSMLAYNESQRAGIIRLVQDMATSQRITHEQASAFGDLTDVQTTLPEHAYAVIVDCVIESEGRALAELCKALKITPFTHAHLKLIINQLHFCELGDEYVDLIMPLLNAVHLIGLNLSFNNLQAAGLNHVLGSLEIGKFDALQRLDLGVNNIDFSMSELACQHFSSAFARLRHLKRLDLRGNRLSRRLRTIFSPPNSAGSTGYARPTPSLNAPDNQDDFYSRRLEYLNLSGCRLMESDFIFLSNSSLIDEIQELDLSDNNFASSTSSLCCILKRIRASVRSLRLERCSLRDQQADRVISAHLALMASLLVLSLSDNAWSTETYRQQMPNFVKECTSLRGLRISYATECYQDQPGNDHDEEQIQLARQMKKTAFYCSLSRQLEHAKSPCRPFRLFCAELDEALL